KRSLAGLQKQVGLFHPQELRGIKTAQLDIQLTVLYQVFEQIQMPSVSVEQFVRNDMLFEHEFLGQKNPVGTGTPSLRIAQNEAGGNSLVDLALMGAKHHQVQFKVQIFGELVLAHVIERPDGCTQRPSFDVAAVLSFVADV